MMLMQGTHEPAADIAGSRGTEVSLGLLIMVTLIKDKTCYRPYMGLPARRYVTL